MLKRPSTLPKLIKSCLSKALAFLAKLKKLLAAGGKTVAWLFTVWEGWDQLGTKICAFYHEAWDYFSQVTNPLSNCLSWVIELACEGATALAKLVMDLFR